jgi:hypothetical protein
MKTLALFLIIMAISQVLKTPAYAQSADKTDVTTYDTSMEKRAALRIKYTEAQRKARVAAATEAKPLQDGAAKQSGREAHSDRSKMVDFMTLSAKRADLRVRMAQVGTAQAYAEWRQGKPSRSSNLANK